MTSASIRQVFHIPNADSRRRVSSSGLVGPLRSHPEQTHFINNGACKLITTNIYCEISARNKCLLVVPKASPGGNVVTKDEDDGVSLGTMKLPSNTDLDRFESLLFQWANSLCQGAMLPLPVPLKVDKIPGGARLGFITIGDAGDTEVLVYIDCLVFPATDGSAPIFRAVRNGVTKDQTPPGEARIMKSLLGALQKSVEIARVL